MQKIIFTLESGDELIPKEYYPVPAAKLVPEWYKKMHTSFADNKSDGREVRETQTIKRCLPVFDSMTAGYIIKTHTDIAVRKTEDNYEFQWALDTKDTVVFHPPFQLEGYKNSNFNKAAPKIRNPWSIKTPKGYSCLFISPMHRPNCGITILEGIVDTDGYTASVQFPCMVDEGFEGTIPAGTPIAQVIPFKRDSFRMEIGDAKERKESDAVTRFLRSTWINGYRNKWRVNKDYL